MNFSTKKSIFWNAEEHLNLAVIYVCVWKIWVSYADIIFPLLFISSFIEMITLFQILACQTIISSSLQTLSKLGLF